MKVNVLHLYMYSREMNFYDNILSKSKDRGVDRGTTLKNLPTYYTNLYP